jgi:hypothetical protein
MDISEEEDPKLTDYVGEDAEQPIGEMEQSLVSDLEPQKISPKKEI